MRIITDNLPAPRFWGMAILGCVAVIPILIGPIITGVLVDYGDFSDSQAGMTSGYGAMGSIVIAFLCALTMHRLPLKTLAVTGISVAMVTNVGAAYCYDQLHLFYGLRVINAIGDGAIYAAVMSAFARQQSSERCYGLFMMFQFGIAGLALWALPTYLPHMTPRNLYLGFFACQLLVLPLVFLLPSKAADVAGISLRGGEWKLLLTLPAIAGLIALCFNEASNIGTDVYLERIAVLAGLSDSEIGSSLGLASVIGVPGAFAIVFVGSRFGHSLPVLVGISIGALSLLGIMQSDNHSEFLIYTCIHSITWAFTTPYIQSILADLDPGGAVVTAGGLASGAGAGMGPAAVAMGVTAGDYSAVLTVSLIAYSITGLSIVVLGWGKKQGH
ncbi:transporter, major facilitator family [Luminiphilus syltensis NOR5-1B]|uniref:Transporter, major facilitator family n=1 Tax=Luminiphilus syltensis NOR5-1B TaxID=565045 RepID=B8KVI1_9GAMM|nr:MFS transporter [Luminiphilus syltensis]EED34855.1 transporter, major facilitator family [Luminiphilus syltensis NOR5-1B]